MGASDILILTAVAVGVAFAVRSVWKRRGRPCGSCGDCRACEGWRNEAARGDECAKQKEK